MKQFPMLYAIMSGQLTADYIAVLRAVKEAMPEEARVLRFTADFEPDVWSALNEVFPRIKGQGCGFLWTQSLYQNLKKNGLKTEYEAGGEIYLLCRKLMVLHLSILFE